MKRMFFLSAMIATAAFTGSVRADDGACEGGRIVAEHIARKLGMTDDQKARAKEILAAAKAEAESSGMPEAKREAMKAAFDQIRSEVLNDEQRGKVESFKSGIREKIGGALRKAGGRAADALQMTEDQRARAKEILEAAKAEAEGAGSPEAKFGALKGAFEKIRDEVLTDEQRAKADAMKGKIREKIGAKLREFAATAANTLGLTDEQKAQAREILQAAHEQAKGAGSLKEKLLAFRSALEKIRDGVLTPEQRIDADAYKGLILKGILGRLEAAGEQPW